MSGLTRKLGTGLLGGALVALLVPATVDAQMAPYPKWEVGLEAGYEFPTADLADMFDPGPAFAVMLGRRVHEQVTITLDGSWAMLGEDTYDTGPGPSGNLIRYGLGVDVNVFDPNITDWKVILSAGGGGALVSTDDIGSTSGASDNFPMLNTGVAVTAPVSQNVDLTLSGQGYWIFLDADSPEMQALQLQNPRELIPLDNSWTFPISLGLRFQF